MSVYEVLARLSAIGMGVALTIVAAVLFRDGTERLGAAFFAAGGLAFFLLAFGRST
jgi:hypothetical protein